MATQTVEFPCVTGQTVTAKLFSFGSDTEVASVSATEAANRKGLYSAAFTDVAAGTYRLIALTGTTPLAAWDVTLTLSTATFQVFEVGSAAIAGYIDTEVAAIKSKTDLIPSDIGSVLIAANSNREVMVTGSKHVAADVHEFQADVIDADAIASSAVTEVQSGLATAAALSTVEGKIDTIDNLIDTEIATLTTEVGKIPKQGETRRYTQIAADEGNKTADVSIGAPL
jgi:hypothetical protein